MCVCVPVDENIVDIIIHIYVIKGMIMLTTTKLNECKKWCLLVMIEHVLSGSRKVGVLVKKQWIWDFL